jgi:hypothetical protein
MAASQEGLISNELVRQIASEQIKVHEIEDVHSH